MPKVELTNALSERIRHERTIRKTTASKLAESLNISTGYLSNIENNKIKHIDLELMFRIFEQLIEEDERESYINTLLNEVAIKYSNEEIESQKWFVIMDLQYRQIPITKDLKKWITDSLEELSLTPTQIISKVNENNVDDPEGIFKDLEDNKVYVEIDESGRQRQTSIRFKLPFNMLDNILEDKLQTSNYITMLGIINAFMQFRYPNNTDSDNWHNSESILKQNKFFSLKERRVLLRQEQKSDYVNTNVLSDSDAEYLKLVKSLTKSLNYLSDFNPKYTNTHLENIVKNFDSDKGFALAFCAFPIYKLKDYDKDIKRKFLKELKSFTDEFIELNSPNEDVEEYELPEV
jgi:transcriptional regulator with XRE-family HTH domain